MASQGWDITRFADLVTLIRIFTARCTATYFPFILADLNLHGIDLFKNICSVNVELCSIEDSASLIQTSFQENKAKLAQHSSSENCASGSESDALDMPAPRSLSVPGRREMSPEKETESSGSGKKSRHASKVVWV
ncbi:unnamed protein product [Prunus brigantina]